MARRYDHSREEIKEMCIKNGCLLLEEKGLSGFSARLLASRIGYSVGTLYNVFGSYEQLLLHINLRTLEDLEVALIKAEASSKSPKEALIKLARAYLMFARLHYHRWSALFEYHLPVGEVIPEWYGSKLAALFSLIEQPIDAYSGCGEVQAAREARALWTAVHGVCALGLSGKLAVTGLTDTVESLLDVLLARYLSALAPTHKRRTQTDGKSG